MSADPVDAARELESALEGGSVGDWVALSLGGLCDHLVDTHHRYLWNEMPRLSSLLAKILAVHGDGHPELTAVAECYAEVRADLEPHLLKEERVLFPMVRDLDLAAAAPQFHCGSLRNPISVMLGEHHHVGALLDRLSVLTDGYRVPADGCASYQVCFEGLEALDADTREHIRKENDVLFPRVFEREALLT